MPRHPEFSISEWENAPEYRGPGLQDLHRRAGTIVLDFDSLQMIAAAQEEAGAFRATDGLDTLKAPVKLGNVPAAFLKVVSSGENDYLVHTPHGPEVLVVINGILTVRNSRFANIWRDDAGASGPLRSGDAIALGREGIRLTAHGLDKRASSLALSILGMPPEQAELVILQGRSHREKEIDPAGRTKLPYED